MSLLAHEQTTAPSIGYDLEEDGVGGRSDPCNSQTTPDKFNDATSDRRDNLQLESNGPVSSQTRRKTDQAISRN